jgi:hypothetical protein
MYINHILAIRHPDDGHSGDRNVLIKNNNVLLNIFINVFLLVYHVSKRHSLTHGRATYESHSARFQLRSATSLLLAVRTLPLIIHEQF